MNQFISIVNFCLRSKTDADDKKQIAKCSSVILQYKSATQQKINSSTVAGIIIFFLQFFISVHAQVHFKTVVPQQPVVAGEPFQVQFIIDDANNSMTVKPPAFNNFRVVAGPNIYSGSGSKTAGGASLKNTVYTLQAVQPGKFLIPGATIYVDGSILKSNDAFVEVISKDEAMKRFSKENDKDNSNYFLRPGEDAYEKIKQNLFVRVVVDKTNCFVGEPVLATFKLYSRLESKSDIVKNPGFYGFTIYDVINLADNELATEKVNGKFFDVHTIRKVQLYPLQSGTFSIDAMEVKNTVEFSKSVVNKKTEQEIVEGVLNTDENETPHEGTESYETNISTDPLTIQVKAVPAANKPDSFNGATGHFDILATVAKSNLAKDEQGTLEITLSGKGNFIQLSAPTIQWPAGMEGFEPTIKDALDKSFVPLRGSRTFRYPFVCDSPGVWQLPPVSISFFDIDSNRYKTISTSAVSLTVSTESKNKPVMEEHKTSIAEKSARASRIAITIISVLVLSVFVFLIFRKKEPQKLSPVQENKLVSVDNLLEPAKEAVAMEGNTFYSILHGIIWKFAAEKFLLSGSEMNKQILVSKLKGIGVNDIVIKELNILLQEYETGMFTNANTGSNKAELLNKTKHLLDALNTILS